MATPTISEYTSHLRVDKSNMRNYLTTIGIDTKESDTFTELTKAVDKIRTQAPQLYTQEEEPVVKQGIWLKGSDITINQILNDTDLYFKEERTYCDSNPLTAAHLATYYYYMCSEGQTYLLTYTDSSSSNDFTLYKVNPATLALEFVIRAKTGVNCTLARAFIRKNILHIGNVAAAKLTYIRFDMTTGEKLSNFSFDAVYNNTSSTLAWSSNAIYNEKYDALFVGEGKSNADSRTYLHRYDFETGQYTSIAHEYGTRSSGFKLHAHPECILVNGSYYTYEKKYVNVYKIGSRKMVGLTGYGDYERGGFTNSAILGGKTYLNISDKFYNVFDYDVTTDTYTITSKVYWNEDQSAISPTISTVIPLVDRLILPNPAASNYTYYSFGGIDKIYPDKTLVLFQGNQLNTAKFSTQLMPSALLSGRSLVTPYNAIYYYTDEYGYNSPYPIYYGNGKRWVPVAPNGSEDTDDYEPLLQNKSVEIKENGTTNIVADEGYDGLNSVEVVTNVSSGGGGDMPDKYVVATAWNSNGLPTKYTMNNIKSIPAGFFKENTYIKEINIQGNTLILGSQSFYKCTNLETVVLPDTIGAIEGNCFYGCSNLLLDKLPSSLDPYMNQDFIFFNCSKITIKKIPDSVTYISGGSQFKNCVSIAQLSMKNIEGISGDYDSSNAFNGCTGLKAVWIGSKITSSGLGLCVFSNCPNLAKIFIDKPRATVEAMTYYSRNWYAPDTVEIICNDDAGFMTQAEFDAIDWSTYTGE